jgi:lipoprotein-anchoring transpeptidase ErfK/SrfK
MRKIINRRHILITTRLAICIAAAATMLQAAPAVLSARDAARPDVVATKAAANPAARRVEVSHPVAATAPQPSSTSMLSGVVVHRELPITQWLRPGEFVWNDEGAPAGETIIVVNIRARILSVYRAGVEIGRSSLISGADNKPTPLGTFPILEKDADHRSNLYDAPMPHMLRLTYDGVALHGSQRLADDAATRGCIGLPREFAALLYQAVRVGDRVIVWDGVTTS